MKAHQLLTCIGLSLLCLPSYASSTAELEQQLQTAKGNLSNTQTLADALKAEIKKYQETINSLTNSNSDLSTQASQKTQAAAQAQSNLQGIINSYGEPTDASLSWLRYVCQSSQSGTNGYNQADADANCQKYNYYYSAYWQAAGYKNSISSYQQEINAAHAQIQRNNTDILNAVNVVNNNQQQLASVEQQIKSAQASISGLQQQISAQKALEDKAATDKAAADKIASDKAAADKLAADKAAADKAAADNLPIGTKINQALANYKSKVASCNSSKNRLNTAKTALNNTATAYRAAKGAKKKTLQTQMQQRQNTVNQHRSSVSQNCNSNMLNQAKSNYNSLVSQNITECRQTYNTDPAKAGGISKAAKNRPLLNKCINKFKKI